MKLTYTGPMDGLSLEDDEGKTIFEEIMHPGRDYELPEHPIVDAWRARKLLVEPIGDASEPSPEDDTSRTAVAARKVRQQRTPGDGETQPQE